MEHLNKLETKNLHASYHPRAVVRIGFAGRRSLEDEEKVVLQRSMDNIFSSIEASLNEAFTEQSRNDPTNTTSSYSMQKPLLRLVSGLCEGSDDIAENQFNGIESTSIETELAAILPFNIKAYRESRSVDFRKIFDQKIKQCSYTQTLDGIYNKPEPDTAFAEKQRNKAYRAQSTFLLRHIDLLIAATNLSDLSTSGAGGTLETVQNAMNFGLKVILIDTNSSDIRLLNNETSPHEIELAQPVESEGLSNEIKGLVLNLLGQDSIAHIISQKRSISKDILDEYFSELSTPPVNAFTRSRQLSLRERSFNFFKQKFASKSKASVSQKPKSGSDTPAKNTLSSESKYAKYARYLCCRDQKITKNSSKELFDNSRSLKDWKKRAADLSRHYSGLYRGSILWNYTFGAIAVLLALVSLFLLSTNHENLDRVLKPLLILGVVKLSFVFAIIRNTQLNHRDKWNARSIDYRYLAERLRMFDSLLIVGSLHPRKVLPSQNATRTLHQTSIEWLFSAILRSLPSSSKLDDTNQKIRPIAPLEALEHFKEEVIIEQADYHDKQVKVMLKMHNKLTKLVKCMSYFVFFAVAVDILIVVGEILHIFPLWLHCYLYVTALVLLVIATLLPALMASLNGLDSQYECLRLAERSSLMSATLKGGNEGGYLREAKKLQERILNANNSGTENNLGSWSLDTLNLSERIVDDLTREVVDWSAIYSKELPET